jgi:hypothetical protein
MDPDEVLVHKLSADARAARPLLPPAVRAVLWLDAVLLVAAALALGGMPPLLGEVVGASAWLALAGSTLTAVLGAFSAFQLSAPGSSSVWAWLPVPALLLWIGASGEGCLAIPAGADVWGDTVAEAGECLRFLLLISAPLLALMLFMVWRAAPLMPGRAMALGALASAGAAASLLTLVHPHGGALLDLGAHAVAIAAALGVSAVAARSARRIRIQETR